MEMLNGCSMTYTKAYFLIGFYLVLAAAAFAFWWPLMKLSWGYWFG